MPKHCVLQTRFGDVVLDARKCAFLPKSRTLLAGDLHFEKASYLQMKGHSPLPAYDTDDTLSRFADIVSDYAPDRVVVLGDSFHDALAGDRLSAEHFNRINALIRSCESFTWILGNHDPDIPAGLSGDQQDHLTIDRFLLTHLPTDISPEAFNICGHLHPKVQFKVRSRRFSLPCFASGENRLILPSFGTYTGGLNVDRPAIADCLTGRVRYFGVNQGEVYRLQ